MLPQRHTSKYPVFGPALTLIILLVTAVACTPEPAIVISFTLSSDNNTDFCPDYTNSELYRSRSRQITLSPESDWQNAIRNAAPDTEIILQNGNYFLTNQNVSVPDNITLRGASSNRNNVVIRGQGYSTSAEGLMLIGNNITIANLSVTDMRDHAISIKPELGARQAPHIYNVNLTDTGTQHLKLNEGGTQDGIVACSVFGYTPGAASGDYNGAIDLHGSINWVLRDNIIYNLSGDGSGCLIDTDCGNYYSNPAILVWQNASGTITERNRIINSFRNIAYGLGDGHYGGAIRNNLIYRPGSGDAGIELQNAEDVIVESNTVILNRSYRGAIEYRQSNNLTIRNNTTSLPPWNRGANMNIDLTGNRIIPNNADTCNTIARRLIESNAAITIECR